MIKLVYCFRKKPSLTDEEFLRLWQEAHGTLGAQIPGLIKLVQSRRIPADGDVRQSDYDGMAELWFEDMASLLAARQSSEWLASTEDEANFIDHSKTAYFVCEEKIVLDKSRKNDGAA